MKKYIHPLSKERVPIEKTLISTIIEYLSVDTYDSERRGLVCKLQEILKEDEVIDEDYIKNEFARLELDELCENED